MEEWEGAMGVEWMRSSSLLELGDAQNDIGVPKPKRGTCNRRFWELIMDAHTSIVLS